MSLLDRILGETENAIPIRDPNEETQKIKLPKKSERPTGRLPMQSLTNNNVSAKKRNSEYSGDNSVSNVINGHTKDYQDDDDSLSSPPSYNELHHLINRNSRRKRTEE